MNIKRLLIICLLVPQMGFAEYLVFIRNNLNIDDTPSRVTIETLQKQNLGDFKTAGVVTLEARGDLESDLGTNKLAYWRFNVIVTSPFSPWTIGCGPNKSNVVTCGFLKESKKDRDAGYDVIILNGTSYGPTVSIVKPWHPPKH